MPLIKRGIEPVNLSRTHVAPGIQNELECVTNSTLANVIRQLSSLSKYAEDMFSELSRDANTFFHRANQIQERVDRLKVKVTQLDSTGEEVSLQDIHMRKPFKSSTKKDQQIITLATRPEAIGEVYAQCDAPPPLENLNPYREDGKDSRKFYTDPTYFFELWCREMQKDTEQTKKELHKRKKRLQNKQTNRQGPVRAPQNRLKNMQDLAKGVEFIPEQKKHQQPYPSQPQAQPQQPYNDQTRSRPTSLELHGQPSMPPGYTSDYRPPGEEPPPYTSKPMPYNDANMANQGNGNLHQSQHWDSSNNQHNSAVPQYQPPPAYNHNHNISEKQDYNDQYSAHINNNTKLDGADQVEHRTTPQHTPTKRGTGTPGSRGVSVVTSPRPSAPPPAPPPVPPGLDSPKRDSLPPPPPPPPGGPPSNHITGSVRGTPPYGSPIPNSVHESPARNTPSPSFSGTPEGVNIPPPPPPPLMGTPDTPTSMSSMPPPPPTPPPPELQAAPASGGPPPPPAPPPPPPLGLPSVPNGDLSAPPRQPDAGSIASDVSSTTGSSGSTMKSGDPPVRDTRSDLLAAIRTGINLRKVEERRQKENQKKHPASVIDVQSIMEAAFEVRRRALEANDAESEEDEGDEWLSDED